ncbi:hypothetical protein [Vulcanisaeta distributa]|nr:hypothetical protein [Vulcanisaeta distributa]
MGFSFYLGGVPWFWVVMSVFPFGSVVEVRPVLVGVTNYAVWGFCF